MSWRDWPDIRAALLELADAVGNVLSDVQRQDYRQFVLVGEEGLALECFADWLGEAGAPISTVVRERILALGHVMSLDDRVASALAYCPDLDDQPG